MTDCPNGDLRDLLPDLLHDRLAPEVRREVEAHVQACGECRQELALLRAMRGSLRRAPSVDVAAIASAIPAYRPAARRSWGGWRAAAAIVILAAGGASVTVARRGGTLRDSAVLSSEPATPVESIATPAAAAIAPRELALGSSAIGDLADRQLSTLIRDLQTLDVLPSAEVENAAVISPVPPAGTE